MSKIQAEIFKANDIRGVFEQSLNENDARLIGFALAAEALERNVTAIALGRDSRLSSPALARALAEGMRGGGIIVHDVGVVPTPALYFAAATLTDGSGVMVTGSHNPKNYNGMKMTLAKETLKKDAVQSLRRRIESDDFGILPKNAPAPSYQHDIREDYIAAVAHANGGGGRALKIVVDAGNGAAGHFAPDLYRAMGCEVRELFCELDGNFPNHHPDPAKPENLIDATVALADFGGDIAFVFDGDGDRLGIILPDAGAVFSDRLLMLLPAICCFVIPTAVSFLMLNAPLT